MKLVSDSFLCNSLLLSISISAVDPSQSAPDSTDGAILPTWTAVDASNVKTSREVWESMKAQGWNVDYHRIPIGPDRPIEDNYLDAYLRLIKPTSPLKTSLVFSCGMGAVRTTFAMIGALVVRRKQLEVLGVSGSGSSPNISQGGDGTVSAFYLVEMCEDI